VIIFLPLRQNLWVIFVRCEVIEREVFHACGQLVDRLRYRRVGHRGGKPPSLCHSYLVELGKSKKVWQSICTTKDFAKTPIKLDEAPRAC